MVTMVGSLIFSPKGAEGRVAPRVLLSRPEKSKTAFTRDLAGSGLGTSGLYNGAAGALNAEKNF